MSRCIKKTLMEDSNGFSLGDTRLELNCLVDSFRAPWPTDNKIVQYECWKSAEIKGGSSYKETIIFISNHNVFLLFGLFLVFWLGNSSRPYNGFLKTDTINIDRNHYLCQNYFRYPWSLTTRFLLTTNFCIFSRWKPYGSSWNQHPLVTFWPWGLIQPNDNRQTKASNIEYFTHKHPIKGRPRT